MTDLEYIQAFRAEDHAAFSAFYVQNERNFKEAIASHFRIKHKEFLADVYQDAIIRMWEYITEGLLTEQTITTTLVAYLYGIGENVVKEKLRKEREIPMAMVETTDEYGLPVRSFEKVELKMSEEEYRDASAKAQQLERRQMIKDTVNRMGEPCAPLLLNFYWEKKSWLTIAMELGYKTADSAKTQKNKCMNKLKALFRRS